MNLMTDSMTDSMKNSTKNSTTNSAKIFWMLASPSIFFAVVGRLVVQGQEGQQEQLAREKDEAATSCSYSCRDSRA